MYADEWAESLKYQYCRAPWYLKRSINEDPLFSGTRGKVIRLLWEDIGARKAVRVEILCASDTMRVLNFNCSCDTVDFRCRPGAREPVISRDDRSYFKSYFTPYLIREPQTE